ncbi:MAG: hypothetical protein WAT39_26635, partial [Planctomycetota bacterium]
RGAGWSGRRAVRCLHGVDVDGTAAALAALAVWEEAGDRALDPLAIAAQIRAGDGLVDLVPGSFDAVLTNPPWETLQSGPDAAARVAALRPRFRHQGRGKLFTYRLFVERAHELLRTGGRLGAIVPASLWFDRDAEPLRRLLLDECGWEWSFGMENRKRLFPIDSRYRFGIVIAQKGGATTAMKTAFGRADAGEWAAAEPPHVIYGRDELRAASPHSGAFVEVEHRTDLELLLRMQRAGTPLTGAGGVFTWRQGDFNMTADHDQFVPCERAEADGWLQGGDAVWRRPGHPDLLPLWQGAMQYDLQPNTGAHVGGTGHQTKWAAPVDPHRLGPAFLVAAAPWRAAALRRCRTRIALRALSNATNERTAIACLLPDVPCGNSLGVLEPRLHTSSPLRLLAFGAAVLGSLSFDWSLRLRLGGTNLNGFVLADCVLPRADDAVVAELATLALRLCGTLSAHDSLWTMARAEGWAADARPATAPQERRALATRIDVLVGRAFALERDDVAWITRGCGSDEAGVAFPKGFFRIERDLAPAERRPARWRALAGSGD